MVLKIGTKTAKTNSVAVTSKVSPGIGRENG